MTTAVLFLDYEEFKPETLQGLTILDDEHHQFECKDYYDLFDLAMQDAYRRGHDNVIFSSSVDDFMMDYDEERKQEYPYNVNRFYQRMSEVYNDISEGIQQKIDSGEIEI